MLCAAQRCLLVASIGCLAACTGGGPSFLDGGTDGSDTSLPTDASSDSSRIPPTDACLGPPLSATCPLCFPGQTFCSTDGMSVVQCGADGLSESTLSTCAPGQLCQRGQCVDPCMAAARENSYQGCEFYATGTLNSGLGFAVGGQTPDDFPFSVVVANEWPVPASVTVEGGGLIATEQYDVPPHAARRIDLPWIVALSEGIDRTHVQSALVANGAVHIRSSVPVAVYQFNPVNYIEYGNCEGPQCFSYTNDASLLLPVASLGEQYMVVSRPTVRALLHDDASWSTTSGFLAVVGTAAAPTTVMLTFTGRTANGPGIAAMAPGATMTKTLSAGDVLQVVSANDPLCQQPEAEPMHMDTFCVPVPDEDITGTIVQSDQPVAVFSGHDCALIPYNRTGCDHIEEQMFPIQSFGQHYIVPRTPPVTDEPNVIRVVATRANTTVTVNPSSEQAQRVIAQAGQFLEFTQHVPVQIDADQPIIVAQFLVGANYDLTQIGAHNGDPDMVLAVPIDQYRDEYEFYTSRDFEFSRAIMVAPANEWLIFDGALLTDAPTSVIFDASHRPLYNVFVKSGITGAHDVRAGHDGVGFSLVVSGVDNFTSYTYPAGLSLNAISPPL